MSGPGNQNLQQTWVAVRELAQAPSSVGPLLFWWSRPAERMRFVGWGQPLRCVEGARGDALDVISSTRLEWAPGSRPVDLPGPWFGGFAFDDSAATDFAWAGFGPARFVLPRTAWAQEDGRGWLLGFGDTADDAQRALEAAFVDAEGARVAAGAEAWPTVVPQPEPAAQARWDALVDSALATIRDGALGKVVLARTVDLTLDGPLSLEAMAHRLEAQQPGCTTFVVRGTDGSAFVGASPETLVQWNRGRLDIDALAGTPAATAGAPSEKEAREHQFVVDGIRASLAPLVAWVEATGPEVLTLRRLTHLRTRIVSRVVDGVRLSDVVGALHPTSALGGTPRDAALHFIREREGFCRGWYGGVVGVVGPERAHLSVAIRSALIRGQHARLFVGAGIVEGSVPAFEWDETVRKSVAMTDALGAAR